MKKHIQNIIAFPRKVLEPLIGYLKNEEKRLVKTKKRLSKEDPFRAGKREDDDASIDSEVMEQVIHDQADAERGEANRALINIRKTLSRIKIGKYGICESCGKMIDTDRLAIKPTAEYCVSCEIEVEKGKNKKK